ncbi:hypothetical protein QT970_28905, partial [Microcoleus sp. herbarium8]|uniref:hypothetical protein n=1 Tax=Microcoleus sp. herbarium8 TaxID=3055436 RepID=UPI002FD2FB71
VSAVAVAVAAAVTDLLLHPANAGEIKSPQALPRGFFLVRPAWAHTCGCKSRHELVTVSEVKRNCVRATERGEEA